ncbi:MotE family protein [Sulfitobacter sp.]|uniref:MotE family protein n=1 Tax=Sulfitobacter sp. TaxID=1903071 RepID=UPI0035670A3B
MKRIIQPFRPRSIKYLTIISIVFFISGAIRIGLHANDAFAQVNESHEQAINKPSSDDTASGSLPDERTRLNRLLKTLQERSVQLAEREKLQEDRQRELDEATARIEARLVEIADAEQQLRETLALSSTAAEDDLARLTAVYENMKPKDAAPLFEAMMPDFAAGFLARMRPDAAAKIMSGLKPEFSYSISVVLAGRNAKSGRFN